MKKIVALAGLLSILVASPASAGKPLPPPGPFVADLVMGAQRIEQQGYVDNVTGCPWDPDDDSQGFGTVTLDPGQSYSGTACVIQDFVTHLLIARATSDQRASFSTRVDYQVGTHLFSATVDAPNFTKPYGSGYWQERQCLWAAYRDWGWSMGLWSPEETPVAANGGVGIGVPATATFTVTNTGTRRATITLGGYVSSNLANVWPNSIALDNDCDPGTIRSINIDQYGGVIDWNQPYAFMRP